MRQKFLRGLFGLQFRTTFLLTVVVLVATGLTGALYLRISKNYILSEAKRQARNVARSLAMCTGDAVVDGDRTKLLGVVQNLVAESDLAYVMFADVSGRLLAAYQHRAGQVTHLLLDDHERISVEPINHPQLSMQGGSGRSVDVVYPVQRDHAIGPGKQVAITVGYVRLALSLSRAEAHYAERVRSVIGLVIGITLLMIPLGYEVVRHLADPINRLTETARAFAAGQWDARTKVKRRDEIGELARAFNSMADELARSHNQLVKLNAELEDRVHQRTMALEAANRKLREMALRDPLTGLHNRRYFNDALAQLFAEATRYGTDLTCLMLDLDDFKKVNDEFGHQTGDQLLQMSARVIQSTIREADVAVRYGGDEFAIVLTQTSVAAAHSLAERMMEKFHACLREEFPEVETSFSIGLAGRQPGATLLMRDLLRRADQALYRAKASGKNRITLLPAGVSS